MLRTEPQSWVSARLRMTNHAIFVAALNSTSAIVVHLPRWLTASGVRARKHPFGIDTTARLARPDGGTGRRAGLKIRFSQESGSSILPPGTSQRGTTRTPIHSHQPHSPTIGLRMPQSRPVFISMVLPPDLSPFVFIKRNVQSRRGHPTGYKVRGSGTAARDHARRGPGAHVEY